MEEKKTKTTNKKYLILGVIILIVCILIIFIYNKYYNTPLNNYKKQSINILNEYKRGEITKEKVKEKLDVLLNKLKQENIIRDRSISLLETNLTNIDDKLIRQELSSTEIDKYVQVIKDIY